MSAICKLVRTWSMDTAGSVRIRCELSVCRKFLLLPLTVHLMTASLSCIHVILAKSDGGGTNGGTKSTFESSSYIDLARGWDISALVWNVNRCPG